MSSKKMLCIIPARGNSKRFPGKNLALLDGIPLIAHTIKAAEKSEIFSCICVSSDSEEILHVAMEYGATPMLRPENLADDTVPIAPVCAYILNTLVESKDVYDAFAMMQPTSPLRTSDDIISAYELFIKNNADAVLSVSECEHPPQRALCIKDKFLRSYFSSSDVEKRTQDLDSLYISNGAVDFIKTNVFLEEGTFFVNRAMPYVMQPERAVDIDEPIHLAWAEFLLSKHA